MKIIKPTKRRAMLMAHLSFALTLCISVSCNSVKRSEITYDFQTKKLTGEKRYYRGNRNLAVTITNINKLKYEVESDVYVVSYADSTTIQRIKNSMEEVIQAGDPVLSAKLLLKEDPSIALTDSLVGWYKEKQENLNFLYNELDNEKQPGKEKIAELDAMKISFSTKKDQQEALKRLKQESNALIYKLEKFPVENFADLELDKELDLPKIKSIITKKQEFLNLITAEQIDSVYFTTNKLVDQLTDSNNYNYYIPEFDTDAEEIELVIRYRERTTTGQKNTKNDTPWNELKLPTLQRTVSPKIGGGTGIVFIHTPKLYNYYTESIFGTDSLRIIERNSKNKQSIAIAIFADLNLQITPKFSIGLGVGSGINVGQDLNGNFYTGLSFGFRAAKNMVVSARLGIALTRQEVLNDRYELNTPYTSGELLTNGITQKSWLPGFFTGVTVSYLIKTTTKK